MAHVKLDLTTPTPMDERGTAFGTALSDFFNALSTRRTA